MFRFNHHHQGVYYLNFAKVIVIKIIRIHRCGWVGGVAAHMQPHHRPNHNDVF